MLDCCLGDKDKITGEIEGTGTKLIVLGKKAMCSDSGKISCKGHPKLTYKEFAIALNGKYITYRNGPVRTVKINNNIMRCDITPFITRSRTLKTTVPAYKFVYEKLVLNKNIQSL